MLKRGILFLFILLLVFLIFLQISFAQENSCTIAHPDSVAPVAQKILQTYSRIYKDEGKAVKAAIDSVNRWKPPENIDQNWVRYKSNIISAIQGEFANLNREYRCSEFSDYNGDALMQRDNIIRRCNEEGKHCIYTKDGAGCVILEKSVKDYTDDITFSEREHDVEAYNRLLEIKDLRSIETLLFFYAESRGDDKLDNLLPLYSAIASTDRPGVERILVYLLTSEEPERILSFLEEFDGDDVVEPLYELFNNNVMPNLNDKIASTLIRFSEHPIVRANYRTLINASPGISMNQLIPILLQIPELNTIYQRLIREGYSEHEAKSIIFVSDRYNQNNPQTSIIEAIEIIKNKRESFENKIIIGPGITTIQVFYEERFDSFVSSKEVTNSLNGLINNVENKDRIRELIRNSRGPTLIWIGLGNADGDGIGIGNGVGLTLEERNRGGIFEITYQELGEDLSRRLGNLEYVVVILDACYTYNMAENLRNYLRDIKRVRTFPTIISIGNRDRFVGYPLSLNPLNTLIEVVGSDSPVLGKHIIKMDETFLRTSNDMAIFYSENNNPPLEIAMDSLNPSGCRCVGDSCPIEPVQRISS